MCHICFILWQLCCLCCTFLSKLNRAQYKFILHYKLFFFSHGYNPFTLTLQMPWFMCSSKITVLWLVNLFICHEDNRQWTPLPCSCIPGIPQLEFILKWSMSIFLQSVWFWHFLSRNMTYIHDHVTGKWPITVKKKHVNYIMYFC